MSKQYISREEAESLYLNHGSASNDFKIVQQISSLHSNVALQQAVKEEIAKNSQTIIALQRAHKGVDFSEAYKDLQQDQVALEILSDKAFMLRMLQGESVRYQRVSLSKDGRPMRNFGVGLLSLNRRIDSIMPVLSIGYCVRSAFNSQVKLDDQVPQEKKVRLTLNVTESTVNVAFRKATGNGLRHEEQNELRLHIQSNDLVKALRKLNDWYAIVPKEKRDEFKNDIATAAYVNLVTPLKSEKGVELSRRNEYPLLDLPLEIKGAKLDDKQILSLAKGLPVVVSDLKERGLKEPYDAILSMNILRGKVEENLKKIDSMKREYEHKLLDNSEFSPLTRKLANFSEEDDSVKPKNVKHYQLQRH